MSVGGDFPSQVCSGVLGRCPTAGVSSGCCVQHAPGAPRHARTPMRRPVRAGVTAGTVSAT
eukprot:COSAG01_NODE_3281_length_6311_cov_20.464907_4_plen_61_part_00